MKTSIFGIFLLITYATCAAPTPAFVEPAPADFIAGAYKLYRRDHLYYRQNPATVWKMYFKDFTVNVDPLKYCHAVYICPFFHTGLDDANFYVRKDMCDVDGSIRYYPWRNELVYKESGNHIKVAHQRTSLLFKYSFESKQYNLKHTTAKPIYNKKAYDQSHSDDIPFNFQVKLIYPNNTELPRRANHLLVLTNSRQCRVTLSFLENELEVFHILDRNEGPSDPHATVKYLAPEQTENSEKKTDLLPYIELNDEKKKALDVKDSPVRTIKSKRCLSPRTNQRTATTTSIFSYSISKEQMTVDPDTITELVLYLKVQNCDWVRLWITEKGKDINTYRAEMELKNTLDIFMYQSFVVLPDSDIARPLQLDNSLTEEFVIRTDIGSDLIRLGYGMSESSYLFMEHFKNDIMKGDEYDIHIIRPPLCYAALSRQRDPFVTERSLDSKRVNMLEISHCKFQIITDA